LTLKHSGLLWGEINFVVFALNSAVTTLLRTGSPDRMNKIIRCTRYRQVNDKCTDDGTGFATIYSEVAHNALYYFGRRTFIVDVRFVAILSETTEEQVKIISSTPFV
jgi:hypothetical protein